MPKRQRIHNFADSFAQINIFRCIGQEQEEGVSENYSFQDDMQKKQNAWFSLKSASIGQINQNMLHWATRDQNFKSQDNEKQGNESSSYNPCRGFKKIFPQSKSNKMHVKKYRERKKEHLKSLQEENRFLKSKIDDLSFRLKEAELQINRLKHNHHTKNHNFETVRESLLNEIQSLTKGESSDLQRLKEVQRSMKQLNSLDNKHKMDLLNYFMSSLLENLVNNISFYFIDVIDEKKITQKGFPKQKRRCINTLRIEEQIGEITGDKNLTGVKRLLNSQPQYMLDMIRNFKSLWKKLYQDYLNIIKLGSSIEALFRPLKWRNHNQRTSKDIIGYLNLELYFERIKYRQDMRQLRESWFHQVTEQDEEKRASSSKTTDKRVKLCS